MLGEAGGPAEEVWRLEDDVEGLEHDIAVLEATLEEEGADPQTLYIESDAYGDVAEPGLKVVGPIAVADRLRAVMGDGRGSGAVAYEPRLREADPNDVLAVDEDGTVSVRPSSTMPEGGFFHAVTIQPMTPDDEAAIERQEQLKEKIAGNQDAIAERESQIDERAAPATRQLMEEAGMTAAPHSVPQYRLETAGVEGADEVYRHRGYAVAVSIQPRSLSGFMYRTDSMYRADGAGIDTLCGLERLERRLDASLERERRKQQQIEAVQEAAETFAEKRPGKAFRVAEGMQYMLQADDGEEPRKRLYTHNLGTLLYDFRDVVVDEDPELASMWDPLMMSPGMRRSDGDQEGFSRETIYFAALSGFSTVHKLEGVPPATEVLYKPDIAVLVPDGLDVAWEDLGEDDIERAESLLAHTGEVLDAVEYTAFELDGRPYDHVDTLAAWTGMDYDERNALHDTGRTIKREPYAPDA